MDLEISDLNRAEDSVQERAAKLLCGGFRENQPEALTDLRSARRTFEAVLATKRPAVSPRTQAAVCAAGAAQYLSCGEHT